MHSAIFALFAISGLAAASPSSKPQTECEGLSPLGLESVKYYVCSKNGFRGWCSEDPCDAKWCRDFAPKTCDLVFITEPEAPVIANPVIDGHEWESETATTTEPVPQATSTGLPDGQCAPGTGFFQSCSNGFRGCCKNDACGQKKPICPTSVTKRDDTVCPPGTGFFQSCSNGFRGCCKNDACGQKEPICPPSVTKRDDTVCPPGTGFFQSCSNGFRGCCKGDACGQKEPICPPSPAKRSDDTVCPPGTGFFQSCSNGFRGCCKGDACGNSWCPDYKTGTYQPAQTLKVKARSNGTCAPNTGYFQVCSNGFKGCCKNDACGQKKPVCPK